MRQIGTQTDVADPNPIQVTTLNLFRSILDENKKKLLPKDAPYQDLLKLINFILRKFFKAAQEDQFLLVEVSLCC